MSTIRFWLAIFSLSFLRLHIGGKTSSSQASSTNTTTTTSTTDRRTVADNGAVVVGDGGRATVTMTDAGAINKAAALGEAAIVASTKAATGAMEQAGKIVMELKEAYASANEQAQAVASGNKTLATLGVIAAAILGLAMLDQRKKKGAA